MHAAAAKVLGEDDMKYLAELRRAKKRGGEKSVHEVRAETQNWADSNPNMIRHADCMDRRCPKQVRSVFKADVEQLMAWEKSAPVVKQAMAELKNETRRPKFKDVNRVMRIATDPVAAKKLVGISEGRRRGATRV